ncbi:DUF6082 family protein [Streptomyces sp. NPDC005784]|uniref:DUF6082 family protein n=1 Tax=Streptomyces sp. NPDC005784 TaxID=3364731 RepID=UPI0036859002
MTQSLAGRRRIFGWTAAGLAAAAAVTAAPLLIQAAAPGKTNWQELSDISQTYGTPLSIIALLGVAVGLAHQSRQTAIVYEEAQRVSHRELVIMAINDPELIVCGDPFTIEVTAVEAKQIAYVNLFVHNWSADYRLKRFNDAALRMRLQAHFRGEMARKHWENGGADWRQFAEALGEARMLRFVSLVDATYAEAVSMGPPRLANAFFTPAGQPHRQ